MPVGGSRDDRLRAVGPGGRPPRPGRVRLGVPDAAGPVRPRVGRGAGPPVPRVGRERRRDGRPPRCHADRVRGELEAAGYDVAVYDGVEREPSVGAVNECIGFVRDEAGEEGFDFYLGLGGGSALDTAKATRAVVASGGEVLDYIATPTGAGERHRRGRTARPVADDRRNRVGDFAGRHPLGPGEGDQGGSPLEPPPGRRRGAGPDADDDTPTGPPRRDGDGRARPRHRGVHDPRPRLAARAGGCRRPTRLRRAHSHHRAVLRAGDSAPLGQRPEGGPQR